MGCSDDNCFELVFVPGENEHGTSILPFINSITIQGKLTSDDGQKINLRLLQKLVEGVTLVAGSIGGTIKYSKGPDH